MWTSEIFWLEDDAYVIWELFILKKCHNRETQDKSNVVQDYSQGHLGDDSEQKEGRKWTKE